MANGLPYAIAAQIAYPDRQCVAFVGDGGFSMLMAEFATCVKYKLPVKVVIVKNNTLGMIKWEQMVFLGNPEYGCELQPIDFAAFARACGGNGIHASKIPPSAAPFSIRRWRRRDRWSSKRSSIRSCRRCRRRSRSSRRRSSARRCARGTEPREDRADGAVRQGQGVDLTVVAITGASAGVGRATAWRFAREGARIGLIARSQEGLEGARREVEGLGGAGLIVPADVADAQAVDAAAAEIERQFGPIDIWINNAMVSVLSPVSEMTPEDYRRVTDVTYLGTVHGTLSALRRMLPRNRGVIVQVGSGLAYRAIPLQSAYCAAKHAVAGFTESLRSELLHDGSRVKITMVQLPALNTPQFDWLKSRMPRRAQPVPPIFQPEVAAQAIAWAARHPRRELWVGWRTVAAIVADRLVPGWLDRKLAREGYRAQQADEPAEPDAPNNLWRPLPGDHGPTGASTIVRAREASSSGCRSTGAGSRWAPLRSGSECCFRPASPGADERRAIGPMNEQRHDSLVRIRPRADLLYVSQGRTVLATDLDGFLDAGPDRGLFVHETRLLSTYRCRVDGEAWRPVALSNVSQHSWLGYYICLPPGGSPAETRTRAAATSTTASQQTLELRLSRYVGGGLHEDVDLTNFTQHATVFVLELELDADFADLEETRGERRQHGTLEAAWRADGEAAELACRLPGRARATIIRGRAGARDIDRGVPCGSPARLDAAGRNGTGVCISRRGSRRSEQLARLRRPRRRASRARRCSPRYGCRSFRPHGQRATTARARRSCARVDAVRDAARATRWRRSWSARSSRPSATWRALRLLRPRLAASAPGRWPPGCRSTWRCSGATR